MVGRTSSKPRREGYHQKPKPREDVEKTTKGSRLLPAVTRMDQEAIQRTEMDNYLIHHTYQGWVHSPDRSRE